MHSVRCLCHAQIAAGTQRQCNWTSEAEPSAYLPGLTLDEGKQYRSFIEAKVACESMYLNGKDMSVFVLHTLCESLVLKLHLTT